MPDSLRAIDLAPRALIELSGDDRLEWLQGQATQDVRDLLPGTCRSFCFCEPTGQMLAVLDAWALEDRIVMTMARETAPAVLDRIERMTILEDVFARELPWHGIAVSNADDLFEAPQADSGRITIGGHEALALRSDFGWDLWSSGSSPPCVPLSPEAAEAFRLEAGIPLWGVDMGPKTLPPEMGPAFEARHVSYSKGCYTGQEVLMRMHSRGHTNRTWVGLLAASPLKVGATVLYQSEPVGTVSSSVRSPSLGPVGAATLRNIATTEGTRVTIDGIEAEVRTMPLVRPQ